MMPPYSCCTPGHEAGHVDEVTSGMLKALQKRMKRAALSEASMSSAPACTEGWLATMPTERPQTRAKPITMFMAWPDCTSRKSALSTTRAMTLRTS
jgi:hypothetical protein